ncbi:radical SAM family RiPP maturation amino acid epimerase [Verrucomicrobia bacterium]|jgi:radical SAM family RiPP maturation amino acid epimerase|nr:radical SAM family RiPP maturation amino acid epimerase [Verrucomicrobiota bacterium]
MSVAKIKRFIERYNADPVFRKDYRQSPSESLSEIGLSNFDPEILRPIWDKDIREKNDEHKKKFGGYLISSEELDEYRAFYEAKLRLNERVQSESSPKHGKFQKWRDRQIARLSSQVIDENAQILVHAPFAIELTQGCSVGCYFCSLDAPKLTNQFEYTEENQQLWKEVLIVLKNIMGEASQWGFCYWATDPLDNPDYEKFASDFAEKLGRFPQTTTAKPLVNVERTRALIKLSESYTPRLINRFSIITSRGLRDVHKYFTPDELRQVELVTLNSDGDAVKTKSGRFYALCKEKPEVWKKEVAKLRETSLPRLGEFSEDEWDAFIQSLDERTCSCVSGFIINMFERKIKLISPCKPSDEYPKGFITFAESSFHDGPSLESAIEEILSEQVKQSVSQLNNLEFRSDLHFVETENGFTLTSPTKTLKVENSKLSPFLRFLGKKIDEGGASAEILALTAQYKLGIPTNISQAQLESLYGNGLLCE